MDADLATAAGLVGDPTRARMLTALMAGRALTATELALEGQVAPSTASSHLEKLQRAGFVTLARQGRHRYYRLGGAEVAAAIEGLMAIAPPVAVTPARTGPLDAGLRRARLCYDHLAGEVGVVLLGSLCSGRFVRQEGARLALSRRGEDWFHQLGIDVGVLRSRRRPLCRACLDWSERRFHLAGALGAALLERLLALQFVRRDGEGRALAVSSPGESFLATLELPRVRERSDGLAPAGRVAAPPAPRPRPRTAARARA